MSTRESTRRRHGDPRPAIRCLTRSGPDSSLKEVSLELPSPLAPATSQETRMRVLALFLVLSATAGVLDVSPSGSAVGVDHDPDLYASAGCSRCHGPTAAGGFGPPLAATALPFEAFLAQLRTPRWRMPAFSDDVVSDQAALRLYEYVRSLEPESRTSGGACAGVRGLDRHGSCSCGGRGHGQKAREGCGRATCRAVRR